MDIALIREILNIVIESGVAEVEISEDDFRLVVRTNPPSAVGQPPAYLPVAIPHSPVAYPVATPPTEAADASVPLPGAPAPVAPATAGQQALDAPEGGEAENEVMVRAPIVGTFYAAPTPGEAPFASVGDAVARGDVLCIIEAMKVMNEIESEVHGRVKKVWVEDAQPVEYDQPLFTIET